MKRCLSHYDHTKRALNRSGRDISFEEYLEDERMHDHQVRCIAGDPDLERPQGLESLPRFVLTTCSILMTWPVRYVDMLLARISHGGVRRAGATWGFPMASDVPTVDRRMTDCSD